MAKIQLTARDETPVAPSVTAGAVGAWGTIASPAATQEYSIDGGKEWIDSTKINAEIAASEKSPVKVVTRVKATASTFASKISPEATVEFNNKVELKTLEADGQSGTTTTTKLTITFDAAVPGLAASDFKLTGATAGVLSGSGPAYTLAISNITVADGANVTVGVSKEGYVFTLTATTVAVNVATTP